MSGGADAFGEFVAGVEPKLRAALASLAAADDVHDAIAEALAYAWRHWGRVERMQNPAGYVYRVARSRLPRRRRVGFLPSRVHTIPEVEPRLPQALARLPERQRVVVFLIHGLEWRTTEVAELLGISVSSVRQHEARGMSGLRRSLGVDDA